MVDSVRHVVWPPQADDERGRGQLVPEHIIDAGRDWNTWKDIHWTSPEWFAWFTSCEEPGSEQAPHVITFSCCLPSQSGGEGWLGPECWSCTLRSTQRSQHAALCYTSTLSSCTREQYFCLIKSRIRESRWMKLMKIMLRSFRLRGFLLYVTVGLQVSGLWTVPVAGGRYLSWCFCKVDISHGTGIPHINNTGMQVKSDPGLMK